MEERAADLVLQLPDRLAERRLRQGKRLGGGDEAALVRHDDKSSKLL